MRFTLFLFCIALYSHVYGQTISITHAPDSLYIGTEYPNANWFDIFGGNTHLQAISDSDDHWIETTIGEVANTKYTNELIAFFEFDIPENAIIKGIEVGIIKLKLPPPVNWPNREAVDTIVQLYANNSSIGNNYADDITFWPTTNISPSPALYGGENDTWGVPFIPQDLAQIGCRIIAKTDSVYNYLTIDIDQIEMTVFYDTNITTNNYQSIFGSSSTQWNITIGNLWGNSINEHTVAGDTMIEGNEYKIVEGYSIEGFKGFLREDTTVGKAWYRNNQTGEEFLIMDLELEVGDSMYIGGNWNPTPGYYYVDSVFVYDNKKHIRFDLELFFTSNEKFTLIEGITSNMGFRYQDNDYDNNFNPKLICSYKNEVQVYNTNQCIAVWPGDANYDLTANIYDILPIGVAYNETGPNRPMAENIEDWQAQAGTDWLIYQANSINYKHIDCNGDGMINADDTLAILQNYGLTHNKVGGMEDTTGLVLYFDPESDSINAGDTLLIPIMLGEQGIPVDSIYGIAFSILYDPSVVDSTSIKMFIDPSWLGTEGVDIISIQKNFEVDGQLDVGITRIDHENVSGYGQIGSVYIVMDDDLAGKGNDIIASLNLSFAGVQAITFSESTVAIGATSYEMVVVDEIVSKNEVLIANTVKLYPNPAQHQLTIETSDGMEKITLFNLQGQVMKSIHMDKTKRQHKFNIQELKNGLYFIEVEHNAQKTRKKVLIEH